MPMKILFVNKFFYIKGGAENSMFQTAGMLERQGHEIIYFSMADHKNIASEWNRFFVSNVDFDIRSLRGKIRVAFKLLYSFEAKKRIECLIQKTRPDLVHLNNIYHQISPSILDSIKKFNLPVVMSLRDYKLVCANQRMVNDQGICELCTNGRYYNCFLHTCVKQSRAKSLLNTMEMYLHHDILKIYRHVDLFISPSKFLKSKLEDMGFEGKIRHLFNFADLNEFTPAYGFKDRTCVYLGRLSQEKGILTLIRAAAGLDLRLKIIGDGPERAYIKKKITQENLGNIELLGHRERARLREEIKSAMFVVVPSEWYENNPRSIVESFALGKPVIGADIGGIPEMVRHGKTGRLFKPGDPDDLKQQMKVLLDSPDLAVQYGKNARQFALEELNADRQYEILIQMYKQVIEQKRIKP